MPPAGEDRWDEIDIRPAEDPLPLLPDREIVTVIVTAAKVTRSFEGGWRAVLTCDVLDADGRPRLMTTAEGELLPVRLPLFFKLPPRKGTGLFQPAARGSKFYRLWCLANGHRRPLRRDRMSLSVFKHRQFSARIHTVKATSDGEVLPKEMQHSIIAELLP